MATDVQLPPVIRPYVGDPNDDPVIQTAHSGKADYVLTADKSLLTLRKVQEVEIISLDHFVIRIPTDESGNTFLVPGL